MLPALEENYSFTLSPELNGPVLAIVFGLQTVIVLAINLGSMLIVTALTYTPLIYQYRSITDPHAVTRSAFISIVGGTGGLRGYSPPQ